MVGMVFLVFCIPFSKEVKLLLPITVCKKGHYMKKLGIFWASYSIPPYLHGVAELSTHVSFLPLLFFFLCSLLITVNSLFWEFGCKVCLLSNIRCSIYIDSCNVNSNYWSTPRCPLHGLYSNIWITQPALLLPCVGSEWWTPKGSSQHVSILTLPLYS
jgi:hypothetical protein